MLLVKFALSNSLQFIFVRLLNRALLNVGCCLFHFGGLRFGGEGLALLLDLKELRLVLATIVASVVPLPDLVRDLLAGQVVLDHPVLVLTLLFVIRIVPHCDLVASLRSLFSIHHGLRGHLLRLFFLKGFVILVLVVNDLNWLLGALLVKH